MVNRTQAMVLGFVFAAWLSLIVILVAAPDVYDEALPALGHREEVEIAFLIVLSAFLGVVGVGVLRRWRWMFWLDRDRVRAGSDPVPVAVLQLIGSMASRGPAWYVVFQGAIGLIQFIIALAMLGGLPALGNLGSRLRRPRSAGTQSSLVAGASDPSQRTR